MKRMKVHNRLYFFGRTITAIVLFASIILESAALMAGVDDVAYFQQFLYRRENQSQDPDFPKYVYHFLSGPFDLKIPVDQEKTLAPWFDLYLQENGDFTLVYKENFYLASQPGDANGHPFTPGACKFIKGHWAVPETTLQLGTLATGTREVSNQKNAVRFRFNENIVTPVLKGHEIVFEYVNAMFSMAEEFCF